MRCEVCGGKIHGKPYRVVIEGAKLTVCSRCSKHGVATWEEEPKLEKPSAKTKTAILQLPKTESTKQPETITETNLELVDGFGLKIKQAREKLGLSHGELGKKLNEKASLLKKIEAEKMTPDNKLAVKLERLLKVKLLVPKTEEKTPLTVSKPTNRELTLGDLIQLNKKEEPQERGQS
ncbi:MAG: multiprotein bridging factor aMBF1 [Candidatus Bathyarchaeia archaeon]